MMKDQIDRWQPVLVAAWHIIGALIIAYLFIIVLMAASAQSRVAGRLKPPLEYSTGYVDWQQSLAITSKIVQLEKQRDEAQERVALANSTLQIEKDQYRVKEAPLRSLVPRLADYADCKLDLADESTSAVAEAIASLQYCFSNAPLPPALSEKIKEALAQSGNLLAAARDQFKLAQESQEIKDNINKLEENISRQRNLLPPLQDARNAFQEMMVVQRNRWLGGAFLTSFPPSMIQIILAFVAGLFGALLVTLVLLVYPNNELSITSTKGGSEARILLGGLISVCVFVVLGGGTAVLGTGSSFATGDINFLAFCAIGILSGMFSDRVAFWLSQRAKTLFQEEDEASAKAAAAATASDTAKQAADAAAAANAVAAEAAAARAEAETARRQEGMDAG